MVSIKNTTSPRRINSRPISAKTPGVQRAGKGVRPGDLGSSIMKARQGYVQGYNAQAVVSEEQIIVAVGVTQEANDVQQLEPMLQTMAHTLEAAGIEDRPKAGLADAGYWSEANIRACSWPEMPELLIATTKDWKQRKMLREKGCPRGRIPKGLSPRDRMERKLDSFVERPVRDGPWSARVSGREAPRAVGC